MPLLSLAAAALAASSAPLPFDLPGRSVVLSVHATGAQIYECKAVDGQPPAWTFREPIATLIKDTKTIGRHYAGPHWLLDDGSGVAAKQAASAPGASPADIPQLKLDVVAHAGSGLLDPVTTVYRVLTHGGRLAGACATPGELQAVPYAADYYFTK